MGGVGLDHDLTGVARASIHSDSYSPYNIISVCLQQLNCLGSSQLQ